MPGVSRHLIDKAYTGHLCTTTIGVSATQFTVFANGSAVLRPGDRLLPHTILSQCGKNPCCIIHPAAVNRGSPNVFAQGIPVARRGDSADKGFMIGASSNVFANGF
jgi:uncharacterized Zn-binding protein involved in type VI secretion